VAWLKAQGVTVEREMTGNGSGYAAKTFILSQRRGPKAVRR
jgi:hypothetical protein